MEIRHLLRSQANEVFEAIKSAGLEPSDFDWEDIVGHNSGMRVSQLAHKRSGYYFTFDNFGEFYSQWEPGYQTRVDSSYWEDWRDQLNRFQLWLSYVRRETESPDL